MCLAFLAKSSRYFSVDFLGETIFLSIVGGRLRAREFYDCVFEVSREWKDARLVCMSPHDLFRDGILAVNLQPEKVIPGLARPEDNIIYDGRLGCEAHYDSQIVTVKVPGVTAEDSPVSEAYSGTLLRPRALVPVEIQQQVTALDIMRSSGTLFQIMLGDLEAGKKYAMRLVVEPYQLLGLKDSLCVQREPNPRWRQEACIFSPKTCRFNFEKSLERTLTEVPDVAPGAAILRDIICHREDYPVTLPIKRHRMLLVAHDSDYVDPRKEVGQVWHTNSGTLDGHNSVEEWTSGTNIFWRDDPECLAAEIWEYLSGYGGKIKEDITPALGISHESCSLIVDELKQRGALAEDPDHRFWVVRLEPAQRQAVFEQLAADPHVHAHLHWRGYVIPYAFYYDYLSPDEAAERVKDNWWKKRIRVISVTALVVGTAGLLIGLVNLIRGFMSLTFPAGP